MSTPVRLRPLEPADWPLVLELNAAEVPRVAPMDQDRAEWIRALADRFDVIEVDGEFAGSVVTLRPGTAYDSKNYRWFSERYGTQFDYLDRIVIDDRFRRRGLASAVYDAVEESALPRERLVLEVNIDPPNQPSLEFHRLRGYREVTQLGEPGHRVSLMTRDIAERPGTSPTKGRAKT